MTRNFNFLQRFFYFLKNSIQEFESRVEAYCNCEKMYKVHVKNEKPSVGSELI